MVTKGNRTDLRLFNIGLAPRYTIGEPNLHRASNTTTKFLMRTDQQRDKSHSGKECLNSPALTLLLRPKPPLRVSIAIAHLAGARHE